MEPIIRAILDSDLPAIRSLMTNHPEAARARSDSGRTPSQVAHAAANFPATIAILRHAPKCIEEIATTPKELLENLIADFSQSTLCSGWNQDIEYDLWALVIDDKNYSRDYDRYLAGDRDSLADIGWVASWAEGWFHWPDSEDGPRFIPMADWKERYQQKTKR